MPYSPSKLEFVRGRKRGPASKTVGYPVIQATVARVIKRRLAAKKLDALMDKLQPRDQAMFYTAMAPYLFTKPAPPKDPSAALNSEIADQVYEKILKQNNSK